MVIIHNGDIETGITAFQEQSKPILREFMQHRYFSQKTSKKHHKQAKSVGGNNRRNKKPQGRRRYS